MPGIEAFKFENTENRDSLREIKKIQRIAQDKLKETINDTIISCLCSDEGLTIARGDNLAHISSLTAAGNVLKFYPEADHIEIGDKITIKDKKLLKNGNIVGEVVSGYDLSTKKAIASVRRNVEKTPKRNIKVDSVQQISLRDQRVTKLASSLPHQISNPIEKSKRGTTLCSRTARLNLEKFGITAPRGASAFKSMNMYPRKKLSTIDQIPSNANVADIFSYALNSQNSAYGDRAAAYKSNGKWFVLDPYTRFPSRRGWSYEERRKPVPLEEYKQVRNVKSVVYYNVNTSSNENLAVV